MRFLRLFIALYRPPGFDPDPHSLNKLDPDIDPQKFNADPKHCGASLYYF
jgi:hypothetical protein